MNAATPRSVKSSGKPRVRALLGGFSSQLGSETLSIHIYHDNDSFVCERRLVERDGTSYTLILPFKEAAAAHDLLAADPYYDRVRGKLNRVLVRLNKSLPAAHAESD